MPSIRYKIGDEDVKFYELGETEVVIGRYAYCDIVLPFQSVSRQHARITCEEDGYYLMDLNSQNGTHLNGELLQGKRRLRHQDKIQIYEVRLRFLDDRPNKAAERSAAALLDEDDSGRSRVFETVEASHRLLALAEREKLQAVLDINRKLGSSLAVDEVMPKILDALFEAFPQADRGFILLVEGPKRELVLRETKDRWDEEGDSLTLGPLTMSIADRAMKDGEGILAKDLSSQEDDKSALDEPIRSLICAPLIGPSEDPLGLVLVCTTRPDRPFSHDDLDALVSVATVAGQALEYAQQHEATLALHRRRERESKRHAEELQRYVDELEQFAFVASHDMKTPVRNVVSCCQLLKQTYGDQLDEEAQDLLEHIVGGAVQMETLLNGLLAYSEIRRGGKSFHPFDCHALVQRVVSSLSAEISGSGAKITSNSLPTITGDAQQIEILFRHLIDNAIKFRGESPPQVRVAAKMKQDKWLFTVEDNGIGIPEQYTDRIFVIFKQLHARDAYPGAGIGLSICKRIVERHGGQIGVRSKPGKGSTLYFTLPRGDSDESK